MDYQTTYNVIPSLYLGGVSQNLANWEDILDHFDATVEDEEVWAIARNSESIPHLGNIYQHLVISRLENLFWEQVEQPETNENIHIFTFINDFDSHFCVNDQAINTLDEFMAKVEEIKSTFH